MGFLFLFFFWYLPHPNNRTCCILLIYCQSLCYLISIICSRFENAYQLWRKHLYFELSKIISTSVQASCLRRWSCVWLYYTAGSVVQLLLQIQNKTTDHLYCQGHPLMLYSPDVVLERLANPWLKFLGYRLIRTISLMHLAQSIITGGLFIH